MSKNVSVVVSVDASHPGGASAVATSLRAVGVEVAEVLEDIGTITASCPEDRVSDLSRIPGVSAVELERRPRVPPRGSPLQ
jgi:hypothetical protein